jgi:hypothetical protein
MAKTVKLTQEHLELLNELQQRQALLKEELAAIGQIKLNIKLRETQIEVFYSENINKEKEIAKVLEQTYGKGNVNIDTGEFTPLQ